jgi:hypothetical protein
MPEEDLTLMVDEVELQVTRGKDCVPRLGVDLDKRLSVESNSVHREQGHDRRRPGRTRRRSTRAWNASETGQGG